MQNSMLDVYQSWLENYKTKDVTASERKLIDDLIDKLGKVTTLQGAVNLFFVVISNQNSTRVDSSFSKYVSSIFKKRPSQGLENLYKQINQWHNEAQGRLMVVNEAKDNLFKISEKIKEIANYAQIEPLITLLKKLVENEELLLLNTRGKSLLACVASSNLQAVLDYLANLQTIQPETANQPVSIFSSWGRGSFEAQDSVDDVHSGCKKIISKMTNAARSGLAGELWDDSNSLLQTAIPIYTDIQDFFKVSPVVESELGIKK